MQSPLVTQKLRNKTLRIISGLHETAFESIALEQLESYRDELERRRFLDYQGALSPTQAATSLLNLLKDGSWNVRSRAAASLGQLGTASDAVVTGLLNLLKDDDNDVRYRAAASLVQLGTASDAVVTGLLNLLKDDSWNFYSDNFERVSDGAAKSLVTLGKRSNRVEPALVNWIEQHQNDDFVSNGIDALWDLVS